MLRVCVKRKLCPDLLLKWLLRRRLYRSEVCHFRLDLGETITFEINRFVWACEAFAIRFKPRKNISGFTCGKLGSALLTPLRQRWTREKKWTDKGSSKHWNFLQSIQNVPQISTILGQNKYTRAGPQNALHSIVFWFTWGHVSQRWHKSRPNPSCREFLVFFRTQYKSVFKFKKIFLQELNLLDRAAY